MVDILSFFIEEEAPQEKEQVKSIYDTSIIRLELDRTYEARSLAGNRQRIFTL